MLYIIVRVEYTVTVTYILLNLQKQTPSIITAAKINTATIIPIIIPTSSFPPSVLLTTGSIKYRNAVAIKELTNKYTCRYN